MKTLFTIVMLVLAIFLTGCDVDVHSTAPGTSTVRPDERVSVDVGDADESAENRAERREERRKNIREAIDNVDVEVSDGDVDVYVE